MTWTQIDPEHFSQYEGMTPSDIGRKILNRSMNHTLDILRDQQRAFEVTSALGADPWNYPIENEDWMTFWKVVYDLKDKDMNDWTIEDFFAYRAMDLLLPWARIATSRV